MNEKVLLLIETVEKAFQDFMKENSLYLSEKTVKHLNSTKLFGTTGNSAGASFTVSFSAYLDDEPYRSITGYGTGSEVKAASSDKTE